MTLYDIDSRLETLFSQGFDEETGEIFESEEELAKAIDEVQLDLDTKIENIGCYIKNLEADVEALKKEEDNLEKRRKQTERKIEGLKNYLNGYLTACYPNDEDRRKWKFKTPKVILGYRKSTKVEVPNLDVLDKEFITVKTEVSANKKAIGEALKNGKEVKGAYLKENINLSIK
jgi:predicted RNase H-like nuclease (RuvC/YqgF family)